MADGPNQSISDSKLKFSIWLATNKLRLKKIFIGALILANAIIYGYSAYMTINYLIIGYSDYEKMMQDMASDYIDYAYFREAQKPKDLEISSVVVLPSGVNRQDIVAVINNPNDNFIIRRLDYEIVLNGKVIRQDYTFIWPKETKYVVALGVDSADTAGGVSFSISSINWQRTSDISDYLAKALKFQFKDVKFNSLSEAGKSGSEVDFKLINETVYGYWNTGMTIILFDDDQIVGAGYTVAENLKAQEERQIKVIWNEPIARVSRVEIQPDIDVFDPSVFIEYSDNTSEPK